MDSPWKCCLEDCLWTRHRGSDVPIYRCHTAVHTSSDPSRGREAERLSRWDQSSCDIRPTWTDPQIPARLRFRSLQYSDIARSRTEMYSWFRRLPRLVDRKYHPMD